ncbi:MAG: hypothetical protein JRJ82_12285 [Deltaproteobacteria bacterium]|nr:hypothetical protein [Deltaproteobacteria bacterium]
MEPVLQDIAEIVSGQIKIVKLVVDENKSIVDEYNIRSLPTLILFCNGKAVERLAGAAPKSIIKSMIESHI